MSEYTAEQIAEINHKAKHLEYNGYKIGMGFTWETTNCVPVSVWQEMVVIAGGMDLDMFLDFKATPEEREKIRNLMESNKIRCNDAYDRLTAIQK